MYMIFFDFQSLCCNLYPFIRFYRTGNVIQCQTGATIRTTSQTIPLHYLEIVQVQGDKVWVVFKETAASQERRVVQ